MTDRTAEPENGDDTSRPVPPDDDVVTSTHTVMTTDGPLTYSATAGRVVLKSEETKDGAFSGHRPTAEVFLVTYTVEQDDADAPNRRPVTFAFNGGPGSSSAWLHLGLLGPRRVDMGDVRSLLPPPYGLVDNAETLLRVSDLVFIDPVSTGYSRAVEGGKPGDFHGYTADLESVAEVIRLWTSRNHRWMSPKFLAGESYGTLRAAALAEHLQRRYGMYLNGLMLISMVLDFASIDFDRQRNDRAHALFLPFYAAAAHYHGKHGDRPLAEVLEEAESYASRDYLYVLGRGARLSMEEREEAVLHVARLTGLSPDYVDRCDLRIEHMRFFTELLRDDGSSIGRLDARFTGAAASGIAETMDADPSLDAILGPYTAAINHYVGAELGYPSDLPYEVLSRRVHPWSYKEFENRVVDVSPQLERAMRANPHLRVHVGYGYLDGATPYFAAEDVVAHLNLPDTLRDNISHAYYEAGHMMYVHEPSRLTQSQDLAEFITG